MKHIIAYSGGLGSFMAAKRVVDKYGQENALCVFTDTMTEDKDLYRFIKETITFLGVKFIELKDGRDIWQVFTDVKFMGNNRIDPCSRILKRDLFRKWLYKNYKPDECVIYYGIGWDEEHRFIRLKERWKPYKVEASMTEKPYLNKFDYIGYLNKININVPRLYRFGFPHNNCGGFCVKTGQAQFKMLLENLPEVYKQHENSQEKLFKYIGKKRPFIRMTVKGKLNYLSLKEFREHLQKDGKIDLFDFGGCGCFT